MFQVVALICVLGMPCHLKVDRAARYADLDACRDRARVEERDLREIVTGPEWPEIPITVVTLCWKLPEET